MQIRLRAEGGDEAGAVSISCTLAALARGEVASFPALRPHQREPWHMFCVQVAAMALIRAGQTKMPTDATAWRELLIALTPEWPGGEAWELVTDDWSRPALLQPPVVAATDRADYRTRVATPDALDMLVTSRNHDLKVARMVDAADEDWLFALVTLQTTEGFFGAGNYGISRMNGGFASRLSLGVRPAGGVSAAFGRDVRRLVATADRDKRRGIPLLWTVPWDGTRQLVFDDLDPLYVDICRRVRLVRRADGMITAPTAGSKVARVAAADKLGNTGDPWAPIRRKDSASVTASPATFGYRKFVELLDARQVARPVLSLPVDDDGDALVLVAAALVRGQGKTEGLHRRQVPLSRTHHHPLSGTAYLDRLGEVAGRRAIEAGEVRLRLRRALLALVQGGPDKVRLDDDAGAKKGEAWLRGYDLAVDRMFFDPTFWRDFDAEGTAHRLPWRTTLRAIAADVFDAAAEAAPRTETRRIRARAVARNMLDAALGKYLQEAGDD